MHIMTVCLGNICRSPAAEAVIISHVERAGLDHVTVSSAGTADYHVGERPHPESVAEGQRRGYAFTSRGAQFEPGDFEGADLILVMDSSNLANVLALATTAQEEAKVLRLGAFASGRAEGNQDVPDPWGQPREAYIAMYDQIEDAVAGLVAALGEDTVDDVIAAARRLN